MNDNDRKTVLSDAQIERQRQRDKKEVRGIFYFYEVPGGIMKIYFQEHEDAPVVRYDLVDGKMHTIPLGVAKHLNNMLWFYPKHEYAYNEELIPANKKTRRCAFQSLEFLEDELTALDHKQ